MRCPSRSRMIRTPRAQRPRRPAVQQDPSVLGDRSVLECLGCLGSLAHPPDLLVLGCPEIPATLAGRSVLAGPRVQQVQLLLLLPSLRVDLRFLQRMTPLEIQ